MSKRGFHLMTQQLLPLVSTVRLEQDYVGLSSRGLRLSRLVFKSGLSVVQAVYHRKGFFFYRHMKQWGDVMRHTVPWCYLLGRPVQLALNQHILKWSLAPGSTDSEAASRTSEMHARNRCFYLLVNGIKTCRCILSDVALSWVCFSLNVNDTLVWTWSVWPQSAVGVH